MMKIVWLHQYKGDWCVTTSRPWETMTLFSGGRIDEVVDERPNHETQGLADRIRGAHVVLLWPSRWMGWMDMLLPPSDDLRAAVGWRLVQDLPFEADELSWCHWSCGRQEMLVRVVACWTQHEPLRRWVHWLLRAGAVRVSVTSVLSEVFHLLWERFMQRHQARAIEQDTVGWLAAGHEGVLVSVWRRAVRTESSKKEGGWVLARQECWSMDGSGRRGAQQVVSQAVCHPSADIHRFFQDPHNRSIPWRLVTSGTSSDDRGGGVRLSSVGSTTGAVRLVDENDRDDPAEDIRLWLAFPQIKPNHPIELDGMIHHKIAFPEGAVNTRWRAAILFLIVTALFSAGWSVAFARQQAQRRQTREAAVLQTIRSLRRNRILWRKQKTMRAHKRSQIRTGHCLRRRWLRWTRDSFVKAFYYDGTQGRWAVVLKPRDETAVAPDRRRIVKGVCPR